MRKTTWLVLAVFVIPGVMAQGADTSELPDPGAVPGDMLYGLERAQESISLALTFNEEARAEKKLQLAEERLSESVYAAEQGRNDSARRAVESYNRFIREANETARETDDEELQQKVKRQVEERREVLQSLQNRLPEQAIQGIQRALERGPGSESTPNATPQDRVGAATGGFVVTGGSSE